jgi:hypothetical protein
MRFLQNRSSLLALLLIAIVYPFYYWYIGCPSPMSFDALGYYSYLPQAFVHHDLKPTSLDAIDQMVKKYQLISPTLYQFNHLDNGVYSIRYPAGLAILNLPFFLAAHGYCLISGTEADGFSRPYQVMIFVSHLFYMMMGFIFLRKILKLWFSETITTLVLLIAGFCTTLLIQSNFGVGMTHGPLFGLQMTIVYLTSKWHTTHRKRTFFLLSLLLGLACITRPTEIILVLIPLLWGVSSWSSLKEKFTWLFKNAGKWLLPLGGVLLPVSVQMAYWWHTTGNPIFYSYSNAGEGFDFLSPHTIDSFFHPRSGLFLYNPLMLAGLFGFILIYKNKREIFYSFAIFMLVYLYVISSWSVWPIGFRSYTQSFGIFSIGLAFLLHAVVTMKSRFKFVAGFVLFFLTAISVIQIMQFYKNIIIAERMTWKYYKSIFGTLHVKPERESLLLFDRYAPVPLDQRLGGYHLVPPYFSWDFEEDQSSFAIDTISHSGKKSMLLNENNIYTSSFELPYNKITDKDHAYLKCSFWFYPLTPAEPMSLAGVIHFMEDDKSYGYGCVRVHEILKDIPLNKWSYFEFIYLTPEVRRTTDKAKFYAWKNGPGQAYIDDLRIAVYEKND